MAQTGPSRGADKVVTRLPNGMRPRLAERARANMRSVNAEIVMILASALGDESKPATGREFGDTIPAAGPNDSARQGAPAHHG